MANPMRTCPTCSQKFTPYKQKFTPYKAENFCSHDCYAENRAEAKRADYLASHAKLEACLREAYARLSPEGTATVGLDVLVARMEKLLNVKGAGSPATV